jgi:hypothetical protein
MRTSTRKGLPLPDITDVYGTNYTVGPPGRTFQITGAVRDTDNAQGTILDSMTEYNQDETITGRWVFSAPINVQTGIGRRFVNNTGSQRVLGDVVMVDPSIDLSIIVPNANAVVASKIGVVAETIPAGQTGYVAFDGFIQVHVVGGVTRTQFLQSQQSSYVAAASTLAGTGSFALVMTTPDVNNMVIACLSAVGSADGGGTIHGPVILNLAANQNAWILDAGALSAAGIQISPRAVWRANAYDTANHQRNLIWRARSTTNAGLGVLELLTSLDAGAESTIFSYDTNGQLFVIGGIDLTAVGETLWTFPAAGTGDIPNRTRFRARTGQTSLAVWPSSDHSNSDSSLVVWMGNVDPTASAGAYVSIATLAAQNQAIINTGGQLIGQANSPALVLAPAGITRLTVPPAGALVLVGDMQMSGNLTSVNATHTGTLNVTGATTLGSTLVVAGASSLVGLTATGNVSISGTLGVTGIATFSNNVNMSGSVSITGSLTTGTILANASSAANFLATGGTYYFVDTSMYITRSGGELTTSHQLGVPALRVGSGYLTDAGGATLSITNHLSTAYDLTVGRNGAVNGQLVITGLFYANSRIIIAGWDVGWPLNVGGNGIASGRFYQRGNGGYYCYDFGDFNFAVGVAANYLVQRDAGGLINTNFINMTSNVAAGKPDYVVGMSGDNILRYWPRSAIGPPASSIVLGTAAVNFPDNGATFATVATLTTDRSGIWEVFIRGTIDQFASNANAVWRILVGASVVDSGDGGSGWHARVGLDYRAFIAVGTVITLQGGLANQGYSGSASVSLQAVFVPTADYPG